MDNDEIMGGCWIGAMFFMLLFGWIIGSSLCLWYVWHDEKLLGAVWALFGTVSLAGFLVGRMVQNSLALHRAVFKDLKDLLLYEILPELRERSKRT